MGRDVQRLTAWASTTESGDRDDLKPGVADRSWSQVSVSARECLGMARCPFGTDCFAERARGSAARADVVVTNHALLAIDAVADSAVLPEHQLLVVDEAHDLVDRVTAVATGELTSTALGVASRRITRLVEPELMQRWERASANFTMAIQNATAGRIDHLDDELATHLTALRDAASAARSVIDTAPTDTKAAAARAEAVASLTEIGDTASRMLTSFAPAIPDRTDVVWLDHEDNRGSTRAVLRVAPLSVAGLLRDRLFAGATAVLTSATLTVGGSFDAMATAWGLADAPDDAEKPWRGIDVGSPFQHAKAGILYVAAHLPPPGRDGTGSAEQLSEIADLITAAGGRTLGLFSSMRAARAAAEAMAERLVDAGVVPGRRQHRRARRAVRRRRGDVAVRHAVAVAGRRRARPVVVVGHHRPHSVSAARRSAPRRPAACGGRTRRQRIHGRRCQPRRAAACAGRRAATARHGRPRGGRGAGLADGDRPLRRLPARLPAAVLADYRCHCRTSCSCSAANRGRRL